METVIAIVACVSFVVWLSYPGPDDAEGRGRAESFSSFPPEGFESFFGRCPQGQERPGQRDVNEEMETCVKL